MHRTRELRHFRSSERGTRNLCRSQNISPFQDHTYEQLSLCRDSRERRSQRLEVTDIAAGGTTYIDVPAGRKATVAVYSWSYPGKFSLNIKAKPGARYTVEISPREESFVANAVLGIAGAIIDASVNENGGAFKLRFLGRSRTS